MAQTWRVTRFRNRGAARPLDAEALHRLALHYVGRYATTRAKLAAYLERKLAERGWEGERRPDVGAIVARMAELRYVDDAAFAQMRAGALQRRGFGDRRIVQALRVAGIGEEETEAAREGVAEGEWDAALAFARRRRLGPFAERRAEREERQKALAALVRAGHSFETARRIVDAAPGEVPERAE